jgi:exopolysaccharide biosynthesis polyprenyl glycosylphosphotransferase
MTKPSEERFMEWIEQRPKESFGSRRARLMMQFLTLDAIGIVVAFFAVGLSAPRGFDLDQTVSLSIVALASYIFAAVNTNAFAAELALDLVESLKRVLLTLLLSAIAILTFMFFLRVGSQFSRLLVFSGLVASAFFLVMGRYLHARLFAGRRASDLTGELWITDGSKANPPNARYAIEASELGLVPDLASPGAVARLGQVTDGFDRVVVLCSPEVRNKWVSFLRSQDIPCEIVAPELDEFKPLALGQRHGRTTLLVSSGHLSFSSRVQKRIFDLILSGSIILLLSPLLLLIAIAIKLESRGPALFFQERVGTGNRRFRIWKFRSMYHEMRDERGDQSTARVDPRVTRVGNILRRTSLDELPQLFNVLTGDMSLVGPRPHALGSRASDRLFWDIDSRYWYRHAVKPGITGLAQVRGFRGATETQDDILNRLESDLEYIYRWSLGLDVVILIRTGLVLLHKNSF